jgi:hypothetical protein
MNTKKRQGMGLAFALVGLVDIFFASTAMVIILIITLNQQIKPPTYIPQVDITLVCYETHKVVALHYGETVISVAISELRLQLQQLSSLIGSPSLRIQVLFHAKSIECYRTMQKQFKTFNQEIEQREGLPFIIPSWRVVSTPPASNSHNK